MAVQSMVAFAFILLSICLAALIRLLSGRLGWIIANVVVSCPRCTQIFCETTRTG